MVLGEIVWVLRGKPYKYPKAEIIQTLELMLQSSKFVFENRTIIYQAIGLSKNRYLYHLTTING
ncbi:MAG: hypothetical protein AB4368_22780 [Xenococcaceae cyanobacterium]